MKHFHPSNIKGISDTSQSTKWYIDTPLNVQGDDIFMVYAYLSVHRPMSKVTANTQS